MYFHFSSYVAVLLGNKEDWGVKDFECAAIKSQIQLAPTVITNHYDCNGTCTGWIIDTTARGDWENHHMEGETYAHCNSGLK
jgi:hypothetical protein